MIVWLKLKKGNEIVNKIQILFQDEYLVVINKPSGLLVHKSPIDKKERVFALQLVRDIVGKFVYPVHRLDKPTSGVLVFALSSEVASKLSIEFMAGGVQKEYLAVARGYTQEMDAINYPLKVLLDKKSDRDRRNIQESQEAITTYERLATMELPYAVSRYPAARYSLIKLLPKTGRKHQLRRHLKHIFHPIVGDTKYGRGEHNKLFREKFDCHRLLLHASKIEFTHPVTKQRIAIEAELDYTFANIVNLFTV